MFFVYHDVHSVAKLQEVASTAFAYRVDLFVISRAQGMAAQTGVPDVHMRAYRQGVNLLVVPGIKEAVDLLSPDKVIVISKKAEVKFDPAEVGRKTMLVVSGSEPDVSLRDLDSFEARYVLPKGLGDVATAAVVLKTIWDDEADNE